jgi:ElaA protein
MIVSVEETTDLATCLAIRRQVFVEEQGVSEAEEIDGLDPAAFHVLATCDGVPSGTARLLIHGDTGKIGRLCVLPEKRGTGLGHALMAKALDVLRAQGMKSAVLAAQIHAVRFYEGIGFHAYGPEYDDAGIAHRDMVLPL